MNREDTNKTKQNRPRVRSKYEAHSLRFLDWVNSLGVEKTWLGQQVLFLEEKFLLRKIALLFLFALTLSYLLTFEFDFIYQLKEGEMSTSTIKSPMSFEITDEVATEEMRAKAIQNMLPIFDYDPEAYEKIINKTYDAFQFMRTEIHNLKLKNTNGSIHRQLLFLKKEFERRLGKEISDHYFQWLVESRFSQRIESLIIHSLENWADFKIAKQLDEVLTKNEKQIIVRVIRHGIKSEEFTLNRDQVKELSFESSFYLDGPGLAFLSANEQKRILKLSHSLMKENLSINKKETELQMGKIRQSVPMVKVAVKKNQILVEKGAVVHPSHIAILKEIRKLHSNRFKDFVALITATFFVSIILLSQSFIRRISFKIFKIKSKDLLLMILTIFTIVLTTKIFLFITDAAFLSKYSHMIPEEFFTFAAPVSAGTMIVGLLISSGEAIWFFTFFLATALSLMIEFRFSFLLVTVIGGTTAALGVMKCQKRNDIYLAGIKTGLINSLLIACIMIIEHANDDNIWTKLPWNASAGLISGILASMITMMSIPLLESFFGYITDIRLLELSNLSHPLMKEMIVKAPGTYHHSLVVSSMVESAAESIGANSLLSKVMSYYHDIGKILHPNYFIENQKKNHNPHDNISPHMSKTILIAHVKDGVEQGMKYNLGEPIIDCIVQHHGTTLIGYFYNKARELAVDESTVLEEEFRYPGPKPQSRESALIMLADSIEAAARSLDEPTPMRLKNIVKNIIQRKFMEGQLDECDLTLRDLNIVENVYYRILIGIYHSRLDYPKNAGGGASESPTINIANPTNPTNKTNA